MEKLQAGRLSFIRRKGIWISACCLVVAVGVGLPATELLAQHRATPAGVHLVKEEASAGKACGEWVSLTYRACQPIANCRDNVAASLAPALLDRTQAELDRKVADECRTLRCTNTEFRNDRNHFACAGPRAVCLTRDVDYRCRGTRAAVVREEPPPQRVLQVSPRAVEETLRQPGPPDDPPPPTRPDPVILGDPDPGPTVPPYEPEFDITTVEQDCIDPPTGIAPVFTAGQQSAAEEQIALVDLAFPTIADNWGASAVSFAADGAPAPAASGNSCRMEAIQDFFAGLKGPGNFAPANWPDKKCNNPEICTMTRSAWINAHYNTWVARSIIHYIAAKPHEVQRAYLWGRPGVDKHGESTGVKTSPEYWFGKYSQKRFETIKHAIDQLWNIMLSGTSGGIAIELRCPEALNRNVNVCYSNQKPSAHHVVKGNVDLCPRFFSADRSDWDRQRLVSHELLHHMFARYGAIWVAIQDRHYHGHGLGCGMSPSSPVFYGEEKIRHLVTYRNQNGSDCGHLARNVRNNDTYAYFITTVGQAVYSGQMYAWPLPTEPTAQPPDCAGQINCQCLDKNWWPAGEPLFAPDGDGGPDLWCPDDDAQVTCQATKFGAQTTGICKSCDDIRGPGCECDFARTCDKGSCFGADTFGQNAGVGRCYEEPPPSWGCLADCQRLFNDQFAWCYADYPTGKARCMDSLCSNLTAMACAAEGKVCRYDKCVVECESTADCQDKGYPGNFECQSHRCEYAFPTYP